MPPLHRSPPLLACSAVAFAALLAIGFLPLFGGPGYESALAAGLVLPSLAAIVAALGSKDASILPSAAFVRALEGALVLSAVALLVTLVHGLRAGFCDAGSGLAIFALGPAMGTVMGACWGFVLGQVVPFSLSRRLRVALLLALSLLGPVLGAALSLVRFYTSPMVFAYDPFFGFFSGTIYDTDVTDSLSTLLTYRAGSAATVAAVGGAAFFLRRNDAGRLRFSHERHPGLLWMTAAAAVTSLIVTAEGSRLGHWHTADSIADTLGATVLDERCELIYPRAVDAQTAKLLLHDCSTQSRQVIAALGVESAPRVRVYMFANPEQKRELTGAGGTSVAKPWRKEVYVHMDEYPHPILGHELAHVLAGTFGRGPFLVAGDFGGWLPDPGLIEGIAVAASPEDDVLTPQQWSSAMLKLDVLPPLDGVFALGFLGKNSSMAYTVAGAFVQWVADKHGMEAVRRWYGGESLDAVAGEGLGPLEAAWRKDLESFEISEAELAYAKSRFDRPGVFQRRCPHAVDAFNEAGQGLAARGDCTTATMWFERAVGLDPVHPRSRLNLASCSMRVSGVEEARGRWRAIADDAMLPETTRLRAQEALADLYLSQGNGAKAEEMYAKLLDKVANEDQLRTLDVKLRGARSPFEGRAVRALLLGEDGRGPDPRLAFALLGKWMVEVPGDGLPAYLIGRGLVNAGLWPAASEFLDWALERDLGEPRIMREALRLRIITACAQRDEATARKVMTRWKAQPGLQEVRWRVLERRLGACVRE
jgi:tetratricopeptide (TPR) repeat protein